MFQNRVVTKTVPTFYFIGVTTKKSAIMRLFPLWMKELGRPEVVIEGVDLKLHDEPVNYRRAVAQIKYDPLSLGALVTTHKIDLSQAARDLFDYIDPYAQLTGEVSCIAKRDGRLEGYAEDLVSSSFSLSALLGENYFDRSGGEILCLGAGGAATAIALSLINKQNGGDRPKRFIAVDRSQERLDHLRRMVESLHTDIAFEYLRNADPQRNDALMGVLPEGSLVINATGMGKDRPGSPITDAGLFPRHGIAWELNYRGELDFMHQALAQKQSRQLTVKDGWLYFLYGWALHIARVLDVPMPPETFESLAAIGQALR